MAAFATLYLRAFIHPLRTFERILAQPRPLCLGARAVAITAGVYALVYFFLAHNGGRPTAFRPWLAIPAEVYYRYNLLFIVPSMLLAWVAAAGCTQLAARALGGRGAYEDTLVLLGFGLSIASWWTGLHDLATTFLGYLRVLDQRGYEDAMSSPTPFRTVLWSLMVGYVVWFVFLFGAAVRVAHRLDASRAWSAGLLGFLVYQGVFVIFNR